MRDEHRLWLRHREQGIVRKRQLGRIGTDQENQTETATEWNRIRWSESNIA